MFLVIDNYSDLMEQKKILMKKKRNPKVGIKFSTEESACWEIWLSAAVDNYHRSINQPDSESGIIPPIQQFKHIKRHEFRYLQIFKSR